MNLDFERMLKKSSHPLDDEPSVTPKFSLLERIIYPLIWVLSAGVMIGTIFLLWIIVERARLYLVQ